MNWREDVAREKRRSFADQPYWGRPIPGWGDRYPRLLIVGFAPAANGANRIGRMFTGDRSGTGCSAPCIASAGNVRASTRATANSLLASG